jgi:hypothetical protein
MGTWYVNQIKRKDRIGIHGDAIAQNFRIKIELSSPTERASIGSTSTGIDHDEARVALCGGSRRLRNGGVRIKRFSKTVEA